MLKPLTEEEKAVRLRALSSARKAEEEARSRAEENSRRAAEEADAPSHRGGGGRQAQGRRGGAAAARGRGAPQGRRAGGQTAGGGGAAPEGARGRAAGAAAPATAEVAARPAWWRSRARPGRTVCAVQHCARCRTRVPTTGARPVAARSRSARRRAAPTATPRCRNASTALSWVATPSSSSGAGPASRPCAASVSASGAKPWVRRSSWSARSCCPRRSPCRISPRAWRCAAPRWSRC